MSIPNYSAHGSRPLYIITQWNKSPKSTVLFSVIARIQRIRGKTRIQLMLIFEAFLFEISIYTPPAPLPLPRPPPAHTYSWMHPRTFSPVHIAWCWVQQSITALIYVVLCVIGYLFVSSCSEYLEIRYLMSRLIVGRYIRYRVFITKIWKKKGN